MEGLGSLGVNISTLIAQVINFVVLFGLLYLVAYKPFMRMLDKRSNKIKEGMEHTEYIKKQAVKTEQETAKCIAEASKEGQNIIGRANELGEKLSIKMRQDAEKEVEHLIAKARLEIQQERDEVIDELHRDFADISILAAGKVIQRSLDKRAHSQLIEEVFEESSNLKSRVN
jgi:F-type H+-transporting ATPase subunit b